MHVGRSALGIDLRPWLRPQLSTPRSPGCGEGGFCMRCVVNGVWTKRFADSGEDRDGALKASRRSEALHYPLPFAQWHMRIAAKAARIIRAELLSPAANRFIEDSNAALQQQFLDKTQAQRKPNVEPDRVGDDLVWEAMTLVADWRGAHAPASIAADPHKALP
jgi:hypothetical protein